jgi:probable rRNA maturation factor
VLIVEASSDGWPNGDWNGLATVAVAAALAETPHAGLATMGAALEVSVRLAGNDEVQALNRQYRGRDKPTNVLSFPMVQADLLDGLANSDDGEILLGDIILAYGVVAEEAATQGKAMEHHAQHLIVHGLLHLLGYDHELGPAHAEAMEAMERAACARLGLADPYR